MSKQSLNDLLLKNKSNKHKPIIHKPKTDRTLFGSGITKREAVKAEKDIEKMQQKAYEFSKDHKDELGEIIKLSLPSTLTDDSIILDQYQQKAVDGLEHQKYGCLIGQAGVGKTTAVKEIIKRILPTIPTIDLNQNRLENHRKESAELNISVAFVSFMGKLFSKLNALYQKNITRYVKLYILQLDMLQNM